MPSKTLTETKQCDHLDFLESRDLSASELPYCEACREPVCDDCLIRSMHYVLCGDCFRAEAIALEASIAGQLSRLAVDIHMHKLTSEQVQAQLVSLLDTAINIEGETSKNTGAKR